ncbi:cardiolipin synthase [Microbacterium rhizomatis]|uniref:Cardiolipin synthase n=1 Tax=Microbacterium rhizomatis TaxID=1631477 RepID=A0A5J5J389_9MICO|nr:cardiolipin synthase [Microbacterium rhizomatis]KAA9108394.1 cardiolipin synthase [Microbacterium rhizomatis]
MDGAATSSLIWTVLVLADLAIKVAALIILPRDRKPTAAMAWLLTIFLIPFLGIFLFFVFGGTKLPKKRMQQQAETTARISGLASTLDLTPEKGDWAPWFSSLVAQNRLLGGIPVVGGNRAVLIGDYTASIAAMTAAINAAKTFVHVEFFIVSWDATTREFFSAMEDAVARGVTVRLLADHLSSRKMAHAKETFAELDRIGATWAYMLPVRPFHGDTQRPDLRNHRKIVVVDGLVGLMGSQNLIDRSYNSKKNISRGLQWQELVTRVEGPAVAGMNAVFLSDWLAETGEDVSAEHLPADRVPFASGPAAIECQVVPSGPGFTQENNLRMFLGLIYGAQEKVIITSPYFVPDEAMVYAITSACQRGLDVQLFVSEIGDQGPVFHAQRSYYDVLLNAGVRIFMYPAPFILHAKHLSIDDDYAVIGSSNMDIRSFNLNFEVSLLVRGKSFVADMRAVEEGYRTAGRELTKAEWDAEPGSSRFLDGLARLTSALE